MESYTQIIEIVGAVNLIAVAGVLSVITEVLKRLPKIPVNSDTATVGILVLATITSLTLAYANGNLAVEYADAIGATAVTLFGTGIGIYKLVKPMLIKAVSWVKQILPKR